MDSSFAFYAIFVVLVYLSTKIFVKGDPIWQLIQFGYLEEPFLKNLTLTDIEVVQAIEEYQYFYQLKDTNGFYGAETRKFLALHRSCNTKDRNSDFFDIPHRNDLTYGIHAEDRSTRELIKHHMNRVSKLFEQYAQIQLQYTFGNGDITILLASGRHNFSDDKSSCEIPFYGDGYVFGHVVKNKDNAPEIHIDKDDLHVLQEGDALFYLLLHQTLHIFNLNHVADPDSIMYGYFSPLTFNGTVDDIIGSFKPSSINTVRHHHRHHH